LHSFANNEAIIAIVVGCLVKAMASANLLS